MRLFKYVLPVDGVIHMPEGARVLHVGVQNDAPTVWALVDPDAPKSDQHLFDCYPTGATLTAEPRHHVATLVMLDGLFVLHVFRHQPVAADATD